MEETGFSGHHREFLHLECQGQGAPSSWVSEDFTTVLSIRFSPFLNSRRSRVHLTVLDAGNYAEDFRVRQSTTVFQLKNRHMACECMSWSMRRMPSGMRNLLAADNAAAARVCAAVWLRGYLLCLAQGSMRPSALEVPHVML